MIVTKRPKRTIVKHEVIIETTYIPSYHCPTCLITYTGSGPAKNVSRFQCNCGQVLIVDRHINKETNDERS